MRIRTVAAVGALALSGAVHADQLILDDLIVDGSLCVGVDCVNGESFGFDTIRLKENNLRIKFQDTSSTASFPSNDWQITANDSSNGGANKFSIDDIDGGRTPFTIEASAPSHSLYVDDGGRIGLGTNTPVVEIHTKDGDTPTLRLEQDGSSGFTPQTWDMAGNETNFFIRDVTNGSRLPVRIRPGAPTSSIDIAASGFVGINNSNPSAQVHVRRTDGVASGTDMMLLESNQRPEFKLKNSGVITGQQDTWSFDFANTGSFFVTAEGTGVAEMEVQQDGDVIIQGSLTANGSTFPDYVFKDEYELMSLADLRKYIDQNKHLPRIPSAETIMTQGGHNMTELQLKLLEKVEELTLYTLDQEERLNKLAVENAELKEQLSSYKDR